MTDCNIEHIPFFFALILVFSGAYSCQFVSILHTLNLVAFLTSVFLVYLHPGQFTSLHHYHNDMDANVLVVVLLF